MTNEEALKKGFKEVEKLGPLAPAILRERLLTLSKMNIDMIKENPKDYNNAMFNSKQYIEVLETFINQIDFKSLKKKKQDELQRI